MSPIRRNARTTPRRANFETGLLESDGARARAEPGHSVTGMEEMGRYSGTEGGVVWVATSEKTVEFNVHIFLLLVTTVLGYIYEKYK